MQKEKKTVLKKKEAVWMQRKRTLRLYKNMKKKKGRRSLPFVAGL